MSCIIGVIMRNSTSKLGHRIKIVYDDIISAVRKSKAVPIMIPNNNIDDYLKICDGFIFQGGDDICDDNLKLLKKLRDKNIPVLGICLGMQEIGVLYGGELVKVTNHCENKKHEIEIVDDSLLYKILGVSKAIVNSRHKWAIVAPNANIGAIAFDGIIEAIYDENLKFFLGIEWHPENMYNEDINARKIFDYFVKICNDKYVSR